MREPLIRIESSSLLWIQFKSQQGLLWGLVRADAMAGTGEGELFPLEPVFE